MNLVEIRKNGIGSNFTVINPKDGYRQDDRLWFGECATCGESVSSSSMSAKNVGWTHSITKVISYHNDGITPCGMSITSVDYCPKA